MTKPNLHPWLDSPQALKAAHAAASKTANLMGDKARAFGDELVSQAVMILTECALPPRERGHFACAQCGTTLESVRPGAKFCSSKCRFDHANARKTSGKDALPSVPLSHIGAMWSWPEERRVEIAVRQISLVLANYLRTRRDFDRERPNTENLANLSLDDSADVEVPEEMLSARAELEDLLPAKVKVSGKETGRELLECIVLSRGVRVEGHEADAELVEAVAHIVKTEA